MIVLFHSDAYHGRFFKSFSSVLLFIARHLRQRPAIMRADPSAVCFAKIMVEADKLYPIAIFRLRPHVLKELDEGALPFGAHCDAAPAVALVAFRVFVEAKHLDSDPSLVFLGFGHFVCRHVFFLP